MKKFIGFLFLVGLMGGIIMVRDPTILEKAMAQADGPNFKVRHAINQVQAGCTPGYNPSGIQCLQHDYVSRERLIIQSTNDYPVLLREIVVNEKPQCSVKPNQSLTLGDTYDIMLGVGGIPCDPLKIRIVTDHGEAVYGFKE
jgi:hypothetical protein